MRAAVRTGLSVTMLLGFHLLAAVQSLFVLVLALCLSYLVHQAIGLRIGGWAAIILIGSSAVGTLRAMRVRPRPATGVVVEPSMAGNLWNLVRTVSDQVGTKPPDEIRLTAEPNAAVTEDTRVLGLVGGVRRLYLGLPLLYPLTVAQLRALVAHELGHYSRHHTRWGAVAWRGRAAIDAAIDQFSRLNPFSWSFRLYARLYRLVDSASSRAQEFEADLVAARVAGPETVRSTLRLVPAVGQLWQFYLENYVGPGRKVGLVPADLFGGFGELTEARRHTIDRLQRRTRPAQSRSRADSHPSTAERMEALTAFGPVTPIPLAGAEQPAITTLPVPDRFAERLQATTVEAAGHTVLPWPEFTATWLVASHQRATDRIFRALARLTGAGEVGLPQLLELVAEGRLADLVEELMPTVTRKEAASRFVEPMATILGLAAIRSGVASWRHSWSGPAALVDPAGQPWDPTDLATLAVERESVDKALARLAELGIDPSLVTLADRVATGRGARIVGAVSNVRTDQADQADHDVIILDQGLVLIPVPKKEDGTDQERLQRTVASAEAATLAEQHRFIPFEDIVDVTILKRVPVRVRLHTRSGDTIAMSEGWTSSSLGSGKEFLATMESLVSSIP